MIIGGSKKAVIEHIRELVLEEKFNDKAELDDPNISEEQINEYIKKFYNNRKKIYFPIKRLCANYSTKKFGKNVNISIQGLENIEDLDLSKGAIITSNHFNPLDSYTIRALVQKLNKKLYIVIQDTNLAMPGVIGFLMNNTNNIPLNMAPSYVNKTFVPYLKKILDKGHLVLIYPEQEMWFNYKKPRPVKRGAYQFAADLNVPVISCFVELEDTKKHDNDEFNVVDYHLHVLKPIYKDENLSVRSGAIKMANEDYEAKKKAYEKAYNKKLDYTFTYDDIAGYKY